MIETRPSGPEPTLSALLAARARAASDSRLVLNAAVGLLVAALALAARPPAWPLLIPAGACFLAYGAWGIADRALHERAPAGRAVGVLRALRVAAGMLGVASVLAVGGVILGFVLGNWIH